MLLNDKKGSGGCKKACANTTFEKVYTISPICLPGNAARTHIDFHSGSAYANVACAW